MGLDDEVIQYFAGKSDVGKDRINRDSRFVEDLGMDSLDTIEIVLDIEQKYGLKIPDEDADKLRTVGGVIDYVREHYKPGDAGSSAKV